MRHDDDPGRKVGSALNQRPRTKRKLSIAAVLLKIAKPEWRDEGRGRAGGRGRGEREKRTKIRLESSSLLDQSKLDCDIIIIIIK